MLLSLTSVQGPEVQQLTSARRPLSLWLPGNPRVSEGKRVYFAEESAGDWRELHEMWMKLST